MAEDKVAVDGPRSNTRGAQVILTGEAQEAARGGLADTTEGNTLAKQALEADGTVADGFGAVGVPARKGAEAADRVVTEGGKPGGSVPAAEGTTRVETRAPAQPSAPPAQPAKA